TVTPEFTVTSSLDEPVSSAVASRLPALLVFAANVNEPNAVRVVVLPLFAELAMPPTEAIVNGPRLSISTAAALFTKDRFETAVFNVGKVPIPVPALRARFVAATSVVPALVPLRICCEAVRVIVFPEAEMPEGPPPTG